MGKELKDRRISQEIKWSWSRGWAIEVKFISEERLIETE
jgi:hypothetical protein